MKKMKAVIFDLDGVVVSTDAYHYRAWKQIADQFNIPFDEEVNHQLRGVSRMESLEIILDKAERKFGLLEKQAIAERKNEIYRNLLEDLTAADILPGVVETLNVLKFWNYKLAIGSSSKNATYILHKISLYDAFHVISDGSHIAQSKPHPEVFFTASRMLGIPNEYCLVVEDAEAGIVAALRAGMQAAAIGDARRCGKAQYELNAIKDLLPLLEVRH